MPPTRQNAKRLLSTMGMEYQKIHARLEDCNLFCNEYNHLQSCPKCGSSRYVTNTQVNDVLVKVLCHFPILPQMQVHCRIAEMASILQINR